MKRIDLSFAVVLSILLMNGLVFSQDTTLTITSNGNVGIGTTTPTAKLDVDGSLAVGDLSRFGNHMLSSRVDSNNTAIDVAVFGSNEGTSGFKVGVLGRTQASTGYGVFSEGNIGVNGNATISGTMRVQNIHGDFTFDGFAPFLNTTLLNTFRGFNGND